MLTRSFFFDFFHQRIVDYRQAHGAFASIEDLHKVKGITKRNFASLLGSVTTDAISKNTFDLMKASFKTWLEDILGLKSSKESNQTLNAVMDLVIQIRKDAKGNKDFVTSDKIRNELSKAGILLKDDKSGEISWEISRYLL